MSSKPLAIIVAALHPMYGIGLKGTMPWRLSNEMKYFRKVTQFTQNPALQNAVIMGRKTYESIPPKFRPLKGRLNVVITRQDLNKIEKDDGVVYVNSIEQGLAKLSGDSSVERVFVIGGAEIYNQCLKLGTIEQLLITEIKSELDIDMDTFLDKDTILTNYSKAGNTDLSEFIGFDVEDKTITEGDFEYQYTLYKKK